MKNVSTKWRALSWEVKLLIVFGLISLLPVWASFWSSERVTTDGSPSMDTHIPRGYVLVPINIENYEAVDSILGRFAIVDLFPRGVRVGKPRPIAINVRLLRAPRNPTQFAVLVPESEAHGLLSHDGSFVVTVKRPDEGGTKFVNTESSERRKIIYEGD